MYKSFEFNERTSSTSCFSKDRSVKYTRLLSKLIGDLCEYSFMGYVILIINNMGAQTMCQCMGDKDIYE